MCCWYTNLQSSIPKNVRSSKTIVTSHRQQQDSKSKRHPVFHDTRRRSTVRTRRERELEVSRLIVDAIPGLLVIRVDVREPAYATTDDLLEVLAVLIQQDVVPVLVWDIRHRVGAVGLHAGRGDGWPTVLGTGQKRW